MKDLYINAAIAALLHDIGKVEQRARIDPWSFPDGFEDVGRSVHAAWSMYFAEHHVPGQYRPAALAGAYHHNPERNPGSTQFFSTLAALADKLSAGERADQTEGYPDKDPPRQMISIFERLSLNGRKHSGDFQYLPLETLCLKESCLFPAAAVPKDAGIAAYEELRDRLREMAARDIPDGEVYLQQLCEVLKQTTWCVPSGYYHSLPDISLYDHLRMSAALAVCLCEMEEQRMRGLLGAVRAAFNGSPSKQQESLLNESAVLLLGGDISGIQDFIYMLSSKGAARTLRGRSFYLQLLTEAVCRYILRDLELPYLNVIYAGGGHFFLLAPLSAAQRLPELKKEISKKLLKHHGTDLYLGISAVEVPASGFKIGRFPAYWDQLHKALNQAKQRRYTEFGSELYETVFKPQAHGGNQEQTCSVCGREQETAVRKLEADDEETRVCKLCESFINDLGKDLPAAAGVALGFGPAVSSGAGTARDVLAEFGMAYSFLKRGQTEVKFDKQPVSVESGIFWAFDDQSQELKASIPMATVRHYTVNLLPQDKSGKALTFEELADASRGISRLGVLRMDVDNLGLIFKEGFGKGDKSTASLARISTLSMQMSLYFEGWVRQLCQRTETLADMVYAVYAGGDDLFLIAPWHLVPGLAQSIVLDFKRYTASNPDLHLSGGMAFIHGKYPVYQAAEDAGREESRAKAKPGKNAFAFLERAWDWTAFEQVSQQFERLKTIVQDKDEGGLGGPQNLLQLIQKLAEQEAGFEVHKKRRLFGHWMWLGDYQLCRMAKQYARREPALSEAIQALQKDLQPFYKDLDQWGTAARWVQLYLRKQRKDKRSGE